MTVWGEVIVGFSEEGGALSAGVPMDSVQIFQVRGLSSETPLLAWNVWWCSAVLECGYGVAQFPDNCGQHDDRVYPL